MRPYVMKQMLDIMAKVRSQNIEFIENVVNTNAPASKPKRSVMVFLLFCQRGILYAGTPVDYSIWPRLLLNHLNTVSERCELIQT